ncbi:nuclear protein MDM1-like isoform X2 [Antedon mediterranea]|uniref:nuclear protein MDM1-like isoform X2 n=1 Tax=Antedon mediterranea TaxID=105859 RepID=UPI003AF68034
MPAINPHSEYKKKFRWHDSFKSASFTPTKQQSAETAGLSSFDFAKTFAKVREPALQHKKRPNFETTYSTRILPEPLVGHENDDLQPSPLKSALRHPPKAAPTRPRNDSNFNNNSKTRVIYSKKDKENDLASNTQNLVMDKKNEDKQGTRNEKEKNEVNRAMQFQAGIRAPQSGGPKYNTEYQRQFAWKKPIVKQSPLIAAEQMVYSSNTNISPYVPDKIQRSSEYQNQFQPWKIQGPKNERDKLKKIAEREIKAKYKIRNKKKRLSPEKMTAAGVPSTIVHEDPGLLKRIQNPQAPFFPHASLKKWKSEYNSNFKSPAKFKYSHGAWKGADPPHIQPRDDSSYRGQINDKGDNIQTSNNQTCPNWFKEVAELRERAKQYKKRARGTHFSREHLAQLLAEQAKLWDQPADNGDDTTNKNDKDQNMVPAGKASNQDDLTPHVETSEDDTEKPTRRKLAWGRKNNQNDNNNDNASSIGSIPTPPDQRDSVSSSSNLEITDENGRVPTPELPDKGIKRRHHFDRTTPYTGGALLTSPQPSRIAVVSSPVPKDPLAEPIYRPGNREYAVDKSPPRYKGGRIKPGITYKKDQGSSDECNNDDDDVTPVKATSRPSKATEPLAASPTAGVRSRDPDPLNDDLSEHSFNRHSNNYFQTSPGVKYLPGTGSPPRTWAAPRQQAIHREQTRPSGGPLDKAHTKNLQGRPLTAKPMSRDQANQIENQLSDDDVSSMSSARQARGKLAAKSTRNSRPRTDHTRDNIHPSLGVSKLDDSPSSDQLSAISSVSSCSLASDILDRARNRRDKFWGSSGQTK